MTNEQLKAQLTTAEKRLLGRKAAKCSECGGQHGQAMYVFHPVDAELRSKATVVALCKWCETRLSQDI